MPSQDGWEEVADYALTWAVEHLHRRGLPLPLGVATE